MVQQLPGLRKVLTCSELLTSAHQYMSRITYKPSLVLFSSSLVVGTPYEAIEVDWRMEDCTKCRSHGNISYFLMQITHVCRPCSYILLILEYEMVLCTAYYITMLNDFLAWLMKEPIKSWFGCSLIFIFEGIFVKKFCYDEICCFKFSKFCESCFPVSWEYCLKSLVW